MLGTVTVPSPPNNSGLTFPLIGDYSPNDSLPYQAVSHRFGDAATLAQQTYFTGTGARTFSFKRQTLSYTDVHALEDFWESMQGGYQSFIYQAPNPDKSTTNVTVVFESKPLSVQSLVNACRVGFNFIEIVDPADAPTYTVNSTCVRFPSDALETALLSQRQQIIPLIHIQPRDTTYPGVYLSDRRVTVADQLYLPRLLALGEKGTGVFLSQSINWLNDDKGSDNVQFRFGNADRIMTQFMNSTDLMWADIDLSLYHVNSGILLQLWKGFIVNAVSDGSSVFQVMCSDGLYQSGQLYPTRTIQRTCPWTFNDGVYCPYSTKGTGGDPTTCDYGYDTANGCLSHGMQFYFGGQPTEIQSVLIKDNSTGVFGIGRSKVTATSIVSDTVFDNALPQIWCNQGNGNNPALNAFNTNGQVIDVRDEGDFFRVLAIIGEGPLGDYTISPGFGGEYVTNSDGYVVEIAPLADGFACQGFKTASNGTSASKNTDLGLRQVLGYFPIQQLSGTYTNPSYQQFDLTSTTPTSGPLYFAAGTAFVELLYPKPSGVAPSVPIQHGLTAPIAQGLWSWRFDASGNRTAFKGETNPFWIAVNCYLRSLGLADLPALSGVALGFADSPTVDPADQIALFDLKSLFVGDGSGAAEIADLVVPVLLQEGANTTETQFQFQGILGQQKPFRQWLQEILNTALGYYTFEFGILKLGIRENAAATSAFTLGNMLYQTLQLSPIQPTFENLVINFADVYYQYQQNSVNYEDKTHEAYYNRIAAPLTKRMQMVGVPSCSQGARIAATRCREEIGGINASEWMAARTAKWKTTLLSLDVAPGDVVSITHPDVPGGTGNFRVKTIRYMQDWSIEIEAQTVTDSMYNLDMGPKPASVPIPSLQVLFWPQPQGEWAPFQVQADPGDSLFPSEFTFDLAQSYTVQADGTPAAFITVSGVLPANEFIPNVGTPNIHSGNVGQSTTGAHVEGGIMYRVAVVAHDDNGVCSPPSDITLINVPTGTSTNTFTINGVVWPPNSSTLTGFHVFCSPYDDLICWQSSGSGLPDSITVNGPLQRSTWALPDPDIAKVRIKAKRLWHGGVIGDAVTSATGSSLISSECVDITGTDDWTGRQLILIGRPPSGAGALGDCPYDSYNITAFNPSSGEFLLDRSTSAQPEDAFVVTFQGYDNTVGGTVIPMSFTDAGIKNSQNVDQETGALTPFSGLTPNFEVGLAIRVISGTSRGATAKIVSNTADTYNFDRPVTLDATSVLIVEDPTWTFSADSTAISNTNPLLPANLVMNVSNFLKESMLVGGFTVDENGVESGEGDAPVRMLYVYGSDVAPIPPPGVVMTFGVNNQGQPGDVVLNGLCEKQMAITGGIINTSATTDVYSYSVVLWTPPSGTNVTIDIYKYPNGSSDSAAVVIGTVTVIQSVAITQFGDFAPNIQVNVGDVFYGKVTQIGSGDPGQGITVAIYWTPQVPPIGTT